MLCFTNYKTFENRSARWEYLALMLEKWVLMGKHGKNIRELYDQAKDVIFVDGEEKTMKHFKEESDGSTVVFSFRGESRKQATQHLLSRKTEENMKQTCK